jgi:hypothetical protein
MFFNDDPDPNKKGRCPAGDKHDPFGFKFVLPHDVPDNVGQLGWRFCRKCFGMFFHGDPNPDPNKQGRCPAGDKHDAFGFLFVLPHRDFPNPSITSIEPLRDNEGQFFAVNGEGFEPNQPAQVIFQLKFSEGGFQPPGDPIKVTNDSSGGLFCRIPIAPGKNVHRIDVKAFDFGSGENREGFHEAP